MFDMRHNVLPENRYMVDDYLNNVWVDGAKILESLQPAKAILAHLEHKFAGYVAFEEGRIHKNLEGVRYNIDAVDTVVTMTGPGRLENVSRLCRHLMQSHRLTASQFIFPLLYLLLRHDLGLFSLAQERVIGHDALFATAANSLCRVYEAFSLRYLHLSGKS